MSCYEESVPKQDYMVAPPLPPAQLPPPQRSSSPEPEIPRPMEKAAEDRNEYQSLIRNPPSKTGSVLKASKVKPTRPDNSKIEEPESGPEVGAQWV